MASIQQKLAELTVPELQKELKTRGLKRSGVKSKLIERLSEAITAENAGASEQGSYTATSSNTHGVYQGGASLPQSGLLNQPQQSQLQMYLTQQQQHQATFGAQTDEPQLFHPQMLSQQELQTQTGQQDTRTLPSMNQLLGGQMVQGQVHHEQHIQLQQQQQQQQQAHILQQQAEQQQQHELLLQKQQQQLLQQRQQEEERQKQLLKQQEEERQRQLLMQQQEEERQQQLLKQQEEERQRQLLKQQEEERQRQLLMQQQEEERQQQLLKQQEEERQRRLLMQQQEEQRQQQLLKQQEEERQQQLLKQEEEERQRQLLKQEEEERQQQLLKQEEEERQQRALIQQEEEEQKLQLMKQHEEKQKCQLLKQQEEDLRRQLLQQQEERRLQENESASRLKSEEIEEQQSEKHNSSAKENREKPHDDNATETESEMSSAAVHAHNGADVQEDQTVSQEVQADGEAKAAADNSKVEEDDGMAFDVQASAEDRKVTEDCDVEVVVKKSRKLISKTSTPVQIKKRKVTDKDTEKQTPRKRRWGSVSNKSSITIDTDALKDLIPETVAVADQELAKEEELKTNEEDTVEDNEKEYHTMEVDDSKEESVIPSSPPGQDMEEDADKVEVHATDTTSQPESTSDQPPMSDIKQVEVKVTVPISSTRVSIDQNLAFPDDGLSGRRIRESKAAANPACNVVHVENLVRPFTLRQLKEFLQQNGTLVEDGFWINKIKSFCFATYASEEEAAASRSAIDGIKWPSGSPKVLRADFARPEEMHSKTDGALGEKITVSSEKTEREQRPRITHERPRHQDKAIEKTERAVKEDSPAKLLDDLFRKTDTKPCLYWLPLTDEQVKEKDKEREERKEMRQKRADNKGDLVRSGGMEHVGRRGSQDHANRESPPSKRFPRRNYRQRSRTKSPLPRSVNRRGSYRN